MGKIIIIEDKVHNTTKIIRPSEQFVQDKNKAKYKELIYDLTRPTYGSSRFRS